MKKNSGFAIAILCLCSFFNFGTASAAGPKLTEYKLEWDYEGLPFEVRTARAPISELRRVAEMGIVDDKIHLPIQGQMPDGKVILNGGESAVVYLFIKNTGKKTIRFSVAPHSTHPGASALGFSFNCLCNGHIYEVPPGKIWYRIMELRNHKSGNSSSEPVTLMHHIFKVDK